MREGESGRKWLQERNQEKRNVKREREREREREIEKKDRKGYCETEGEKREKGSECQRYRG